MQEPMLSFFCHGYGVAIVMRQTNEMANGANGESTRSHSATSHLRNKWVLMVVSRIPAMWQALYTDPSHSYTNAQIWGVH
jgi:hypothetical protein